MYCNGILKSWKQFYFFPEIRMYTLTLFLFTLYLTIKPWINPQQNYTITSDLDSKVNENIISMACGMCSCKES